MTKLIKQPPTYISARELPKGFVVEPGRSYTLIIEQHEAAIDIIEAEDTLFRNNSALFLPSAIEDEKDSDDQYTNETLEKQQKVSGLNVISGFFRFYQICVDRGAPKHVLITGHADSVGKESSNEALSQKRAAVIESIILGGKVSRSLFVKNVVKQHTKEDQQHILNWLMEVLGLTCNGEDAKDDGYLVEALKIDGKIGNQTHTAIRAVKKELRNQTFCEATYNGFTFSDDFDNIRKTLINDTEFGANLWAAVYELYQAELYAALKKDNFNLNDIRQSLKWVDEDKKSVGCGETWPIEARGKNNYKSQSNRRVEILFYDSHEIEELPCKDAACAKDDCHIFKNIDKYNPRALDTHLKWEYIPFTPSGRVALKQKFRFSI